MERIPPVTAAYKVVEEIRDYSQLGRLKKEQDRLQQQIYMFNMFIASKHIKPIMSLIPLQSMGSPTGSNKEAAIRTRNELLGSQQDYKLMIINWIASLT